MKYEIPCPSECGGKLKQTDNPKTPSGLFTCEKCGSMYRLISIYQAPKTTKKKKA